MNAPAPKNAAPMASRRLTCPVLHHRMAKRVTDRGRASFVLLVDNRWITLGRYPALGLAEAREKARSAMEKPPERAPTFAEAADDYARDHVPTMRPSLPATGPPLMPGLIAPEKWMRSS